MITKYLMIIVIWNMVTFLFYYVDKQRAIKKHYRISEKTLLIISLCLGGFGAMLGGYICHHKTKKWYFQLVWCLSLFILIGILIVMWRIK